MAGCTFCFHVLPLFRTVAVSSIPYIPKNPNYTLKMGCWRCMGKGAGTETTRYICILFPPRSHSSSSLEPLGQWAAKFRPDSATGCGASLESILKLVPFFVCLLVLDFCPPAVCAVNGCAARGTATPHLPTNPSTHAHRQGRACLGGKFGLLVCFRSLD